MSQKFLLSFYLLLILGFQSLAFANERHLEIIPLKHRPPETLIPVLSPLTDPQTSLSASGNNLIVRAAPAEIQQLKALIDELDTPLAQFKISVRTGNQSNISESDFAVQHQGSNFTSTPTIKRSTTRNGVTIDTETRHTTSKVVVHRNSSLGSNNTQQQVRATEGYPAYISVGKEVPINHLLFWDNYHDVTVGKEYKPVVSGFYVVPQLSSSEHVMLSLSTQKQALQSNRQIKTQGYSGTVRGRLGEWIQVGGIGQQDNQRESALNRHYSSKLSDSGNIYLKVERIQ